MATVSSRHTHSARRANLNTRLVALAEVGVCPGACPRLAPANLAATYRTHRLSSARIPRTVRGYQDMLHVLWAHRRLTDSVRERHYVTWCRCRAHAGCGAAPTACSGFCPPRLPPAVAPRLTLTRTDSPPVSARSVFAAACRRWRVTASGSCGATNTCACPGHPGLRCIARPHDGPRGTVQTADHGLLAAATSDGSCVGKTKPRGRPSRRCVKHPVASVRRLYHVSWGERSRLPLVTVRGSHSHGAHRRCPLRAGKGARRAAAEEKSLRCGETARWATPPPGC